MTLPAGSRLLAEDINRLLGRVEAVLGADETRTSNTTFSDSALLVALEANKTYDVDFYGAIKGSNAGDFKSQWTFPANASVYVWQIAAATNLTGAADEGDTNYGARAEDTSSPTSPLFAGCLDTTNAVTVHQRLRVVMGNTAGNLRLQWAQNASSATATTLLKGAILKARLALSTG